MYFLELHCENAKYNHDGTFQIEKRCGSISKWTVLPSGRRTGELLRLAALSMTGLKFSAKFSDEAAKTIRTGARTLRLESLVARHRVTDFGTPGPILLGSGVCIGRDGEFFSMRPSEITNLSRACHKWKTTQSADLARNFLLAYGPGLVAHDGTDDFEFNNPRKRLDRIGSLFRDDWPLTDPAEFLLITKRLAKFRRFGPMQIMRRLAKLPAEHLHLNTCDWADDDCDLKDRFQSFSAWKKRMLLPVVDICRHMKDAFAHTKRPLDMPGVLLLHSPHAYCIPSRFEDWLRLVDEMFPNLQIIASMPKSLKKKFPDALAAKRLPLPASEEKSKKRPPTKVPSKSVLLIQVDGRLPNLALMKLSRHFKSQGKNVVLTRGDEYLKNPEAAFASCIFNFGTSPKRLANLRKYFGDSLVLGGSGCDVRLRLDESIENLAPDFDLYPELDDRAIGFLTRGCPKNCPFCIVPQKEGRTRQVTDLDSLLQKRKKLILLDDNILAHPDAATFLAQMARRDLRVNFTQTLDIAFLDKEKAALLKQINCQNTRFTRPNHYFSLNNDKNLDAVAEKYRLMDFSGRDNVEFLCMYGFDTTLAQDVRRFKFLRALPGAYVFVQEYRPVPGGPLPSAKNFFDDHCDDLIDELAGICFTQNMKSMERYFKWVSRAYAETFGKLHMNLVDTIFRYNNRHRKGAYIETLAGTRKSPTDL